MCRFVSAVVSVTLLLAGCAVEQNEELAELRQELAELTAMSGPPPSSLDSLYPPIAPAPLLLVRMLDLGQAMSSVAADFIEQDVENARAGLERFRAEYAAVSQLVPEWRIAYPSAPLDSLAAAIASGDPERFGPAFARVGAVCDDCHVTNMTKVHYKYRWRDFRTINPTDPESGRVLTYKQLKQEMETAFAGIGNDLSQQQTENARAQYATFRARFSMLTNTCVACHATERTSIAGPDVQQLVQRLGVVLQSDAPDATLATELGRQIGMESCSKCHLVHAPAALTKRLWEVR